MLVTHRILASLYIGSPLVMAAEFGWAPHILAGRRYALGSPAGRRSQRVCVIRLLV
jgi:hypothetical protein